MKERFWMFGLMCMLLTGIITALIIPERYVMGMIEAERQANYAFLGYETARNTESRAERWFEGLFIRTGMMDASYRATTSDLGPANPASKLETWLEKALEWTQGRVRVLWAAMFQLMVRISIGIMWLPITALILTPFVIDSLVSRKIKANSFAVTSPHLQALGTRSIFWIALGYGLLQLLPLQLHPVWTPLFIGVVALSIWLSISQFAKRA